MKLNIRFGHHWCIRISLVGCRFLSSFTCKAELQFPWRQPFTLQVLASSEYCRFLALGNDLRGLCYLSRSHKSAFT